MSYYNRNFRAFDEYKEDEKKNIYADIYQMVEADPRNIRTLQLKYNTSRWMIMNIHAKEKTRIEREQHEAYMALQKRKQ